MRKKVFLLVILIFSIIISSIYLKYLVNNKIPYEYKTKIHPFIVNTNDILIESEDSFNFNNFFIMRSINDYNYSYLFNDNILNVTIYNKDYNKSFKYCYQIKEPEVVEVIKEVYKEIYVENKESDDSETIDKEKSIEEEYFSGYHDLYYPINSDISDIIVGLTKDIKTNIQVAIDYSNLNPNVVGEYDVFYLLNDSTIKIKVFIENN